MHVTVRLKRHHRNSLADRCTWTPMTTENRQNKTEEWKKKWRNKKKKREEMEERGGGEKEEEEVEERYSNPFSVILSSIWLSDLYASSQHTVVRYHQWLLPSTWRHRISFFQDWCKFTMGARIASNLGPLIVERERLPSPNIPSEVALSHQPNLHLSTNRRKTKTQTHTQQTHTRVQARTHTKY